MTLKYKLTKLYYSNSIVTVDRLSLEDFLKGGRETIEHKIYGIWLEAKPTVVNYKNYYYGLGPSTMAKYFPNGKDTKNGKKHGKLPHYKR